MTETTLLCAVTDALCPVTKYGSVGRLAASSEAKIIDLKTGTSTCMLVSFTLGMQRERTVCTVIVHTVYTLP